MSKSSELKRSFAVAGTAIGAVKVVEKIPLSPNFGASVNGLEVTGNPKFEDWAPIHKPLTVIEKGSPFAVGDWILYGEAHFGELASQMIDPDLGWSLKTINGYKAVAERVTKDRRRMDRLTYTHHRMVAHMTAQQQEKWLKLAAADEEPEPWPVSRLAKSIKAGEPQPPTMWYVLVGPLKSGQIQDELMQRLEHEGLIVKAITRHGQKSIKKKTAA